MGLLDILNGMQNGPHGQRAPTSGGSASGGMSPITMAILALLAYKAMGHVGSGHTTSASDQPREPAPGGTTGGLGGLLGSLLPGASTQGRQAQGGFDLGSLLSGGLGGLLGSGASGSVLSGGLNELLKQFQSAGHGQAFNSWVGTGSNQDISESEMAKSIGSEQIDALVQQTGMSRQELLAGLSRELPGVVDRLTPEGRVPSAAELSGRL